MSMHEIHIIGEGFAISLKVHGYERLLAKDESDLNWLNCELSARVGVFAGTFEVGLTSDEIESWSEEIFTLLQRGSGEMLMESEEDNLRLEVALGETGRATLSGRIVSHDVARSSLEFHAESDRTYLARLHAELRQIVRDYPKRVSNDSA